MSVIQELDDIDKKLLDSVNNFTKEHCNENHPLACGILHEDGTILYSVTSKSPLGYDVHAEHSIVSQARIYDKEKKYKTLVTISSTGDYKIKAPCGICRELLRFHYPNLFIIIKHQDKIIKVQSKYLLPFPYISTKLPEECILNRDKEYK